MEGTETTVESTTPVESMTTPVISEPVEASTMVVEPSSKILPEVDKGQWYFKLDPESQGILTEKDKQYKSFEDYIKATHELRGKLTQKGIIPPSEDATPSEKEEFIEQIKPYLPSNVPEGGNYELKALEGIEMEEEAKSEMFSVFADLELSNEQADKILEFYGKSVASDIESAQAEAEARRNEAEKELKQKWGAEYEQRIERASTLLDKLGNGFGEFAAEAGLFTQVKFMELLDKMGSGEATLPAGTVMSPTDIQTRINEIKADPKFMRGNFEEREALTKELRELISRKNGM